MPEKSIFLPAFGNKPDQFVGRDSTIEQFIAGLRCPPAHPARACLLMGQRGMGKTALLLEFAVQAEKLGFIVARVTASISMLEDILGAIQRKGASLTKQRRKVKGVSAGAFGFSVGLSFSDEVQRNYSFLNKLILLCEKLREYGKPVLFLIDEVQSNTPEMQTFATAYQHLVGEGLNVAVAMAGLPQSISAVLNDKVLTFLNRTEKIHLDPLPLGVISVYYAKVFRELGKSCTPAQLERIVAATRGYPYLLQLIGFYILEYASGVRVLSDYLIGQALTSSRHDLIENIYQPALSPLSNTDLAFIKAMAKDSGTSSVKDIEKRMKTTAANTQAYRKRLIDSGIITSERRGELSFTLPYMAEYLRGGL